MNAMRFVTDQDLGTGPIPRERVCPFCIEPEEKLAKMERRSVRYERARHALTDDWICTGCRRKVVVHRQRETCDNCGKPCWVRYFGNRRKVTCDCDLSQEERDAIALAEVEHERQRAIAQRKAVEEQLAQGRRQKDLEQTQRKADRCWESKGRKCSVKAKKPAHSFCSECKHLKPRTHDPPPSHLEDDYEQIEFETDETEDSPI